MCRIRADAGPMGIGNEIHEHSQWWQPDPFHHGGGEGVGLLLLANGLNRSLCFSVAEHDMSHLVQHGEGAGGDEVPESRFVDILALQSIRRDAQRLQGRRKPRRGRLAVKQNRGVFGDRLDGVVVGLQPCVRGRKVVQELEREYRRDHQIVFVSGPGRVPRVERERVVPRIAVGVKR